MASIRCLPGGAYDGAVCDITTVLTIGPRRRPSTCTIADAVGAASAPNHHVCRPLVERSRHVDEVGDDVRSDRDHHRTCRQRIRALHLDLDTRSPGPHTGDAILGADVGTSSVRDVRQLRRQRPDPALRHSRASEREHADQQARERVGCVAALFGEDPREEGLQHFAAQRTAQADVVPPVPEGAVGTCDGGARTEDRRQRPADHRDSIPHGEEATAERHRDVRGMSHRVREFDCAQLTAHPDPDGEALQPERLHVHPARNGRVGGVEHLESAIEQEAVEQVGALTPADRIGRLEHHDVAAGECEL